MKPFVIRMNRRQYKWTCGMDREMFFDEPCAIKRTEIVVVIHSQPVSASNPFPLCYYGSCLVGKPLNHCAIICEAEYMYEWWNEMALECLKRTKDHLRALVNLLLLIWLFYYSGSVAGEIKARGKNTPPPLKSFSWRFNGKLEEGQMRLDRKMIMIHIVVRGCVNR